MSRHVPVFMFGGAERDRTVGLLNAIQALSQLSYSPTEVFLSNSLYQNTHDCQKENKFCQLGRIGEN
jgi:hypothetical protein